jgi:hypothetical protein
MNNFFPVDTSRSCTTHMSWSSFWWILFLVDDRKEVWEKNLIWQLKKLCPRVERRRQRTWKNAFFHRQERQDTPAPRCWHLERPTCEQDFIAIVSPTLTLEFCSSGSEFVHHIFLGTSGVIVTCKTTTVRNVQNLSMACLSIKPRNCRCTVIVARSLELILQPRDSVKACNGQ